MTMLIASHTIFSVEKLSRQELERYFIFGNSGADDDNGDEGEIGDRREAGVNDTTTEEELWRDLRNVKIDSILCLFFGLSLT